MSERYPHVFSPIRIGPVDVRNRVYMASVCSCTVRACRRAFAWRAPSMRREIADGQVTLYHVLAEQEQTRAVDAVVLLTMRRSLGRRLEAELIGKVDQVYSIGDAAAPRGLFEAVYTGQRFGRMAVESEALRTPSEAMFSPVPDDAIQRSAASLLQLVS